MDIGISGMARTVEDLTTQVKHAADSGFGTFWTAQIFGLDALTALAVAGAQVPDIRLGTAVIPTYPRHPMMLAQQALTANQVTGGRITLGIGLSHKPVVEGMWGISFDRPVRHASDYLEILMPLINEGKVSFGGDLVTGRGEIDVPADPCPVLFAALGPQMLELAGRLCDGTITWMVGPGTIAELTLPAIAEAAEAAGRGAPQLVASVPICVTDDKAAARELAATEFMIYGQLPSYRAMLDREGLAGPEDIAVIGTEGEVTERLEGYIAAGATSLAAGLFGTKDERATTRALLERLNG